MSSSNNVENHVDDADNSENQSLIQTQLDEEMAAEQRSEQNLFKKVKFIWTTLSDQMENHVLVFSGLLSLTTD